MKILVTGGGGQVAAALSKALREDLEVTLKKRSELDISDAAEVALALRRTHADWLINAAAYTAVDLAETDGAAARAVNLTAVGVLARAASQAGCRLLHLSTDFVFDGLSNRAYLTTDVPNPTSAYGASKLGGELEALSLGSGIVLRTSWVYASYGKNFVLTMLRLMRDKPEVRVVCDQIGAPTWAGGLAEAIWACLDASVPSGIYHWCDLGVASWYDFAVAIQEEALECGLLTRKIPVLPIATSAYPTPARRPAFSVLDSESTRRLISLPGNHWRHNLRMMLNELRAT